jgi:hypothetical protein
VTIFNRTLVDPSACCSQETSADCHVSEKNVSAPRSNLCCEADVARQPAVVFGFTHKDLIRHIVVRTKRIELRVMTHVFESRNPAGGNFRALSLDDRFPKILVGFLLHFATFGIG